MVSQNQRLIGRRSLAVRVSIRLVSVSSGRSRTAGSTQLLVVTSGWSDLLRPVVAPQCLYWRGVEAIPEAQRVGAHVKQDPGPEGPRLRRV